MPAEHIAARTAVAPAAEHAAPIQTPNLDRVDVSEGIGATTPELSEKHIAMMDLFRCAAVSYTSSKHWIDFSGNPYMTGDAGQSAAYVLGISISKPAYEWIKVSGNLDGEPIQQVEATIVATRGGRTFTDHGDCDSFDPFVRTKRKELRDAGATPQTIATLLRTELKKKAAANARGRAVGGWLGLRGVSWDFLVALGLKREDAGGKITHRTGRATKGGKAPHKTVAEAVALPSGSTIALTGRVTEIKTGTTKKKTPWCELGVRDDTGALWVRMWDAAPEWLVPGMAVTFGLIEIGEYSGKPQYIGHKIEQVETPTEEPANGTDTTKPAETKPDPADTYENERAAGTTGDDDARKRAGF